MRPLFCSPRTPPPPALQGLAAASLTSANGSEALLAPGFSSFCFLFASQPPCPCPASSRAGRPCVGWLMPPASTPHGGGAPRQHSEAVGPESYFLGLNPCPSASELTPVPLSLSFLIHKIHLCWQACLENSRNHTRLLCVLARDG